MNRLQKIFFLLLNKNKEERSTTLQIRLFSSFAMLILALGVSLSLILLLTGVFDAGERENRIFLEHEASRLFDSTSESFGRLSVQGISFSEHLASNIDAWLQKNNMSADEISMHPDLVTDLLSEQLSALLSTLQNSECSGSFLILDATINPELENSQRSRAGIFLKRTEPNAVNLIQSKIYYLRGPASLARKNGIELLGQWQMEFDTSDYTYFHTVIRTARNHHKLSLSRLFYWSRPILLRGNSESGIFLCLPLISSDGTVYGICGLEVGSMLFKLKYSPDNSVFPRIFSSLSPAGRKSVLSPDEGLIAGNSYLTNQTAGSFDILSDSTDGLCVFQSEDGERYIGIKQPLSMYSLNSPYESEVWEMTVMMPMDDWNATVSKNKASLYGSLVILLIVSLLLAAFISRRYIKPVINALDTLKADSRTTLPKTKITEIDDLLEFLSMQDEQREALKEELVKTRREALQMELARTQRESAQEEVPRIRKEYEDNTAATECLADNLKLLSRAERTVFNLYMEGHTAKEIAEILCLSINTIKTHNRRIYNKLNVRSRKELMSYATVMFKKASEEQRGH